MAKTYENPQLVEYGSLVQMTLGGSGLKPDINLLPGGSQQINSTSPTCSNNVVGSQNGCYTPVSTP